MKSSDDPIITIHPEQVWNRLQQVMDPEIPVLSVVDLGMITAVQVEGHQILVKMIPTFSACPALLIIRKNIQKELEQIPDSEVVVEIDPQQQWNSNRITQSGREKLQQYQLTPPPSFQPGKLQLEDLNGQPCPRCQGLHTYLRSPFGSTLCRALHYCRDCQLIFEQFKPLE
ncbi:MAG: 1,2-phenylacetyl-CoA epoxidase subunit PaaD [Chitinophagaceae bacterium]